MKYLQMLLENGQTPILTAFILGILTAVSPCPMATNITAIGYISKDLKNRHRVFINGILYTVGRILSYALVGTLLIAIIRKGVSIYPIQKAVSHYGEILISPVLILIGIYLLDWIHINLPMFNLANRESEVATRNGIGALLLGVLFALAFCPTSGIFFFGMLIPLSVAEPGGYFLPVVYAIATSLPVIVAAWIIAYSMASIGHFYKNIQVFEKWFRKIIAVLFILVGCYYGYIYYL